MCPCHGGVFYSDGTRASGPPPRRLYEYEYKVVVTSKKTSTANVLQFHNGRGSQEGIFAELKSQTSMEYLPSKTLIGNKIYLTSAILAHNLNRELQMQVAPSRKERSTVKRAALWLFEQIGTFRRRVLQRAGRLTRPGGVLTLTCSGNEKTARELSAILRRLAPSC